MEDGCYQHAQRDDKPEDADKLGRSQDPAEANDAEGLQAADARDAIQVVASCARAGTRRIKDNRTGRRV